MATIGTFAAFSSRGYSFAGSAAILPTGGNYVIDNSVLGKRVHVFTSPGTFTIPSNASLNSKFADVEILLVGGGGNAVGWDDAIGGSGGGGGGGVVYDSAFRIPKGFSLSVNVGAANDATNGSRVPGLPTAMGGGNGGNNYNYSKGQPGGTGGGGSWQNGAPNGPAYSVANPGWTYGNTGPSAPTNTQYFMPVVLNNSESASNVANALGKTWSTQFLSEGNGQYGCTTNAPDSSKGLPGSATVHSPSPLIDGTFYSPKAFRMRGGGGAAYAGGIPGQGVLTDFINKENGSYQWIMAAGMGEGTYYSGNSYESMVTFSGVESLKDSGVLNGTYYPTTTGYRSPATTNWLTYFDDVAQGVGNYDPAGKYEYGSGGGREAEQDGSRGIVVLRYDLTTFPGGAPSASANVFGGNISTSANGKYRYHMWPGDNYNSLKGTSANSQGYVAFDNDEEYRLRNEGAVYYSEFRGNGTTAANTQPFYFNRELPPFTVQYMIIGGGGSSGTKGSSADWRNNLVGGGGSGGMAIGVFTTGQVAPQSWYFPSLGTNLANSASGFTSSTGVAASQDYGYMRTGSFSHRPGYVEVRANSMLNNKLPTDRWVDSAASPSGTVGSLSKQNSTTIKIRGTENSYAQLVQRDRADYIYEGYLGNNGVAENPDQQYLIWNYNNVGNPTGRTPGGTELYDMIQLSDYDHYFYSNYVRARAGRRGRLHVTESDINSSYTDGTSDTGPQTRTVNRNFTLGHKSGGPSTFIDSASPGGTTGTHPRTGESYYNAIKFNDPLCTWSKASDDLANDRWTPFYNQLNSYNVSRYDNDVYSTPTPTNPDAVTRINRSFTQCGDFTPPGGTLGYYDRRIHFSNANSAGTVISNRFNQANFFNGVNRQARIQYVEECCNPNNPSFGKRRFQYLDWWGGDDNYLTISGDWKLVSVGDAQIFTYTNVSDENHRTLVEVYKRSLRSIWVKQYFAYDINAGEGGKGNRQGSLRRRSGGTSSIHAQDSNTPLASAGGGGAGGWGYYDSSSEGYPYTPYSAPGEGAVQAAYVTTDANQQYPVGIGSVATQQGQLSPAGGGGGPGYRFGRMDLDYVAQRATTPSSSGSTNASGSNSISQGAGGGSGGGSLGTREFDMGGGMNTFLFGGATRGGGASGFSQGKQAKRSLFDDDGRHGGRGLFGSTYNWSYYADGATNLASGTTYWYLNINQFPHNATFASGGGGGAAGNGGDGSAGNGGTGGNGADGVTYTLTGYPTVYGAGGGGFGRRVNGYPGSGMPADPSTVSPVGDTGPAYTPYGIGGGWSPGMEEGGGPDGGATKYYPGSGPWPVAYPVSAGQAHMDAMRYRYGTVPAPQKGNIGSYYSGRQGVVIIAYNAAPYYS